MKNLLLLLLGILCIGVVSAQNTVITDDDSYTADPSAMLDVKSVSKGLLVPRMSTTQRIAIASPANGLLVFDTDEQSYYFYSGSTSAWTQISYGQIWEKNSGYVFLADPDDNVGVGVSNPGNKLLVKADTSTGVDESIFAVLNTNGDTVFAVYNQGVRIWVNDDGGSKATGHRGGFAVGGFSPSKAGFTNEYLRVTPDSVRVYIDDDYTASKATGSRGGFAVGGFSPSKGSVTDNYLFVQDDSTRVYVEGDEGFAIDNIEAGNEGRYMDLTPDNYFIGHDSGKDIIGGIYNQAIGYKSGSSLTNGDRNVFLGYESGFASQNTQDNVFIGYQSGYNSNNAVNGPFHNVFIGSETGYSNTTGGYNVFIGYESGYSNISGNFNTATGYKSFYSNLSGSNNTAIGLYSLYSNTVGINNTAIGYESLYENTVGERNSAIGYQALMNNETGNNNTACGHFSLYGNTAGDNNVALGYSTLVNNTTGTYNTAVGCSAFTTGSNCTNSTGLGYGAQPGASNSIRLGNSSVSTIGGYANWTNFSDGRFKKDVQENVGGLDFIMKLRPVTYHLDMDAIAQFNKTPDSLRLKESEKLKAEELQCGFIAQEVEQAANKVGFDFHGVDKPKNETSHYGLRYAEFVVPMVKAIQEQQELIINQSVEIQKLKEELEKMKTLIDSSIKNDN